MDIDRVVDIPDIVSAACVLHNICCLNEDDIMQFPYAEDQQPQNIDMENIFPYEATAIQKWNAIAQLMF